MGLSEITVVAAIIYNSENKVLITQRPEGFHLAGLWEFPGGKVEDGETFEEALKREIKEETNLNIVIGDLYWKETVDYSKKRVHLFFYKSSLNEENQKVICHEISDFKWLENKDLKLYKFPEADAELINRLMDQTGL